MTRLIAGFAVLACGAGLLAQQPPTFRGTAETVPVFVTVTDKSNRLVTSLTRADFEIRDNGKVQPLTNFDNTPQPVRLIVMLDVSGSMARNLPLLRGASGELFQRLGPQDLARVGTFGNTIDISPTFTRDVPTLLSLLPESIGDARTPLWRGIDQAIGAFGDAPGRHVVMVLSDSKDSGPAKFGEKYIGQLEVTDRANREDVMIYGIGVHSRPMGRPMGGQSLGQMLAEGFPDPGLGTVALDTGGGYLEIRPRDDLAAAFARVADELHSQYLLGFTPPARDGKEHKIEVRVTGKDLKPRARKNYRAAAR